MHTSATNMKTSLQTVTSWALLLLWTPGFSSKAVTDCGYAAANGKAFVVNGKNATVSEFPWHVGLYIASQGMEQVCGGSLVLPRVVITAAHCLYYNAQYGKLVKTDDLKVSVGSPFRDWSVKPQEAQRRNVSRLFPHPRYRGRARHYADDIAIIELESPISLNAYVVPVCVDWENKDVPSLSGDSVGKVVGWGQTAAREPSPTLLSAELPFIPFEQCAEKVPLNFLAFLTNDKFCAGHIDGAAVSSGDSGGGLAFQHAGLWYLMGVVSVGRTDLQSYAAFTTVADFSKWIGQVVKTIKETADKPPSSTGSACPAESGSQGVCKPLGECSWALDEIRRGRYPKTCPSTGPFPIVCCVGRAVTTSSNTTAVGRIARQKCQEYSRQVYVNGKDVCVMSDGKDLAQPMEFPHMALLGYGEDKLVWNCGGSLIAPNFVLTAAHCVAPDKYIPTVRWVQVGMLNRPGPGAKSEAGQRIAVAERIVHPDYKAPIKYNDIALLRLERPAQMNAAVRPACLQTEPARGRAGDILLATGWGTTELGGDLSEYLKKVELPLVDHGECNKVYSEPNTRSLPRGIDAEKQVCAGAPGRDVCSGDAGGPLQVASRNSSRAEPYCSYKIVGIVSFGVSCFVKPGVYTRVQPFVPWIERTVWPTS